jgi:hypothetical protein
MRPFLPSHLPDASNPIKPMERAHRWCKASTREQWQHLLLRGTGGHHLLSTDQVIAAPPPLRHGSGGGEILVVEESWKCVEVEICWEWVAVSPEAVVRLLGQVETGILLNAVERAHQMVGLHRR